MTTFLLKCPRCHQQCCDSALLLYVPIADLEVSVVLPKGHCPAKHLKRVTVWGAERDSSVTGLHSFPCSFTTYSSDFHSPRKRQWKLQMFLSLRASSPGLWNTGTSACSRAASIQHRSRTKHGAASKIAHTAHWNTSDIAQVGCPHFYMEREASTGKVICKKRGLHQEHSQEWAPSLALPLHFASFWAHITLPLYNECIKPSIATQFQEVPPALPFSGGVSYILFHLLANQSNFFWEKLKMAERQAMPTADTPQPSPVFWKICLQPSHHITAKPLWRDSSHQVWEKQCKSTHMNTALLF